MNPFSVVCDPGHGGKESPGATFHGLRECDVTLDVALRVKRIVSECTSENPNLILSLTRDRDKFVGLNERAQTANVAGADYFLSLHCNADQDDDTDPSKEAKGEEVWYAKGSKMGLACALVLVDFIDETFPTKCRGAKGGDFTVLTATHMPANLVEMGFIDAISENEGFMDPLQLEKIANTIAMSLFYIQGAWEKLKANSGG
jgi:N-acetylmuramoyl-L-alanine amidase